MRLDVCTMLWEFLSRILGQKGGCFVSSHLIQVRTMGFRHVLSRGVSLSLSLSPLALFVRLSIVLFCREKACVTAVSGGGGELRSTGIAALRWSKLALELSPLPPALYKYDIMVGQQAIHGR